MRQLRSGNFSGWVDAVEGCLNDAGDRLPENTDRRALAEFALVTMEGGIMLASSYRDVAYFDRAVEQLKDYFNRLLRPEPVAGQHKP